MRTLTAVVVLGLAITTGCGKSDTFHFQLAQRSSRPSCRLSWDSWDGHARFCLSEWRWSARVSAGLNSDPSQVLNWRPVPALKNEGSSSEKSEPQMEAELDAFPWASASETGLVRDVLRELIFEIECLRERVARMLEPVDQAGLLRKLLLNEKPSAGMGEGGNSGFLMEQSLLRLVGWVHLSSASGMHLLAWVTWVNLAMRLGPFRWVFLRWEGLGIRLSRIISFSGILWIWILSGARPGLLRPMLVIGVRALARQSGRRVGRWLPLLVAGLVDFCFSFFGDIAGRSEWAPGREHYALAVAGGLAAWDSMSDLRRQASARGGSSRVLAEIRSHAAMAIGSWIWIVPLDLMHGYRIAPLTPVLSLISIPILAGVFYPVLILLTLSVWAGADGVAEVGFDLCARAIEAFCRFLQGTSVRSSSAVLGIPYPAFGGCILVALIFWVFLRRDRPWSGIRLSVLGSALVLRWTLGTPGWVAPESSISQLDVGQGESALILDRASGRVNGWAGLVDAGSARALSVARWKELLTRRGVDHLDGVFLTHLDEDHSGGLLNASRAVPIGCVLSSRYQWETPRGRELRAALEERGMMVFALDKLSRLPSEIRRTCLPDRYQWATLVQKGPHEGRNSNMSAIRVWIPRSNGLGGLEWISFGDASMEEEKLFGKWLVRVRGDSMPSGRKTIFKLSHHGSRHSTDPQVIRWISPSEIWISAGVGNRHGHPSREALDRIRQAEGPALPIRRTDREGVIDCSFPAR